MGCLVDTKSDGVWVRLQKGLDVGVDVMDLYLSRGHR